MAVAIPPQSDNNNKNINTIFPPPPSLLFFFTPTIAWTNPAAAPNNRVNSGNDLSSSFPTTTKTTAPDEVVVEDNVNHPVLALAYSGYDPAPNLAPWLTGLILALVVFVILIPAFCSACYHYFRYVMCHYVRHCFAL